MLVVTLLLAACSGGGDDPPSVTPAGSASSPTRPAPSSTSQEPTSTAPAASASSSPTRTVAPVALPPGVPASYGRDVDPGDLPAARLVPAGAEVTGTAYPDGSTAIVTWAVGDDPFGREQGLVVWRRTAGDTPPWSATFAFREPPRAGVLGIQMSIGDATGDGAADALVFESVGGSGACGTWRLLALAPGADAQTYDRDLCDASVEFASGPSGLRVIESIFAPGDAHCCPSGTRTTSLAWTGSRWRVISVDRSDAT
jgi:hypothetical protein